MIFTNLSDRFIGLTLPPLPAKSGYYQPLLLSLIVIIGLAIAWLPPSITALLLAGLILGRLLLSWPILSLYLLIPLIPFSSLLAVPVGGVRVGLMEISLALGLLAALLYLSVNKRLPVIEQIESRSPHFFWPFILFLGGVSLSWLNTLSVGASLVETAKWLEMLALYLLLIAFLPHRQLKWVVTLILITGSAQALIGLYQFIFKVGPPGFLLFGGRFLRAYGTFAQPNPYAGYLGLILPLALALLIWQLLEYVKIAKSSSETQNFKLNVVRLVLLGGTFGLLLAALLATQSRGAWLAFAAAAGAVIIGRSRRPGLLLALLLGGGATIGLAGAFDWNLRQSESVQTDSALGIITQRFVDAATIANLSDIGTIEVTDANFATLERLAHWQAAREMWRDHPWLGVGFGTYAVIYPAYASGRWLDPLGHAHNYLLNIGAETGLIGIMGYLIFWIYAFKVIWSAVKSSAGINRAIAIGCFGTLVHFHIHNLFDNLYVQGMYLYIALILAIISLIHHTPATGPDRTGTRGVQRIVKEI